MCLVITCFEVTLNLIISNIQLYSSVDEVFVHARSGTLVSADSTGSVQFWDSQHGTLLQAHSYHKGDANALAAAPGHNRVFSAGSDGQVQKAFKRNASWYMPLESAQVFFVICFLDDVLYLVLFVGYSL